MSNGGKTILVVDDDNMSMKMTELILQENGYTAVTANSGECALEILRQGGIDLVLLDIEMPGMSGIETLDVIRGDQQLKDMKVIFLTVMMVEFYKQEASRLGAADFVQKPVLPVELVSRISKVLRASEKQRILVVDDDSMNLRFAKRMLGDHYEISCVSSGSEALATIGDFMPHLALLDLHMPEMNGYELLAEIRKIPQFEDLPVVFLTADNDRETEIQVFKAGALDYIQKPFIADVVLHRLNRILDLKRLQSSLQDEVEKQTAELSESRRKVTNLSLQVVTTLASTIDAKDKYTNGHSIRVAKYSRELGRRMGKTPQELEEIYFIAMLHDIGKIGIPDAIINKTSKLTDDEYNTIKTHPGIGAEILKNISEMPNMEIGAHWHHERYDGRGYPDGLKGSEIPEIARIIAVADAYDAMTSRRSYRSALPQEVVRGEIEKGKGLQFDPQIADKMLDMIDDDRNYAMRDEGNYGAF
ncbi:MULTISPECIES: response regulator [unclassified Fibrobacter]|uniref:response regulator n=1 Tax=unclassified Fibrobacter TaxID=2634177 RepID=UPI000D6D962A|nr:MULTISPECIES: response regulator [unclassified Fibrobacter]PWJ70048.1 putative two-component system response regulator [Fibrobacter sp. UWR4]PZW73396.1 putative two-component system response regulator [Fibrobacter sp. UWR1]